MERGFLSPNKLPVAIATGVVERIAVRPAVVAPSVVIYGETCSANRHTGERIAEYASAVFAIGDKVVAARQTKRVVGLANENQNRAFAGTFFIRGSFRHHIANY